MFIARSSMSPLDFHGLRIFDYTAGQSLGSSVAVIEIAPGVRHAEAWSRRSDKYYLVTRGRVRFTLDGDSQGMDIGDFCVVRQGRHFSYANEGHEPATLVLVHTPGFDLREEVFAGQ